MRWIVAAVVVLAGQLVFGLGKPAPPSAAPAVEALLAGRSSTPQPVALAGRVVEAAPTWGDGVRLTLDVETADDAPARGLVSVSLRETSRSWRSGDRVALRSRLRRLAGFGNFGELEWAAYNARRGVFVSASAWRAGDAEALPAVDGALDRIRRRFAEACARVGGQGAEILEALVIGDRTGIDRATDVAVRDSGLAHFLAISGSHMALIVALVVALVRRAAGLTPTLLERYDVMRAAAVAAALAVVGYGAVCGGGVSVVRSELMALAAMAALWRGRPGDDLRALGASAMLIAAAMPGVGEEAGFQLSYLAVAALIADSRRRRRERREAARASAAGGMRRASLLALPDPGAAPGRVVAIVRRGAPLAFEALRLTLLCWAVTSPVVAHHFQRVSLVAPVANLLAAPLVSAIVVSGIAGLVLLPWSPAAGDLAVRLGALLSDLVIGVASWCAAWPHAAMATPTPGALLTTTLTALVFARFLPGGRARRGVAAGLAAAAALQIAAAAHDRWRSDRLDVWFASVGQGDGAVVRMPGGAVWSIDQGPPGRGRMVIGPLLRRAWIGRVDVLVASHLQSDHSGGLAEILDEFDVGEVWIPDGPCDGDAARTVLAAAAAKGVPVRFVSTAGLRAADGAAAERPASGAASVSVLGPPRGAAACNVNDQSLVLAVAFGGRRVLFTGDIEAAAEARVVAGGDRHPEAEGAACGAAPATACAGRAPAARADVLKVPHHGSRTSSTAAFLDAVAPSLAIASVGLDNQWHFPAPDVVARYDARGIRLLRTDRDGAVHLAVGSDGALQVETFREASQPAASGGGGSSIAARSATSGNATSGSGSSSTARPLRR